MATMMKFNDSALAVMQQMLQERCIAEPSFAIKMANPSKSMEGASYFVGGEFDVIHKDLLGFVAADVHHLEDFVFLREIH